MKRVKKTLLLPVRCIAYRFRYRRLYYWSEKKLFALRCVCVMPRWYYRWLYRACMRMVEFGTFRKLADRTVHTIPYHIRFEVA